MKITIKKLFLFSCGLLICSVTSNFAGAMSIPLDAVEIPSTAKGISGKSVYSSSGIDTVNVMNGNLTLSVPIGLNYPVGPSLSYQLAVYYNSGTWDFETYQNIQGSDFSTGCERYINPDSEPGGPTEHIDFDTSQPSQLSNAGLGWHFSLGRLLQPFESLGPGHKPTTLRPGVWTYVSPSGAKHGFYGRLHPEVPEEADESVLYTTDGSYMRLRSLCSTAPEACGQIEIDFSDGTIHKYQNFGDSTNPDWRLIQIRDQYVVPDSVPAVPLNFINISYDESASNPHWQISDSQGRNHSIHFATNAYKKITKAIVEKPSQTSGVAQYDFEYFSPSSDTRILRHRWETLVQGLNCIGPGGTVSTEHIPHTSDMVRVDLLKSIRRPMGSKFQMEYYIDDDGKNKSGAIERLTLPTGGIYEWKYGLYSFSNYFPPGGNGSVVDFPEPYFGPRANYGVTEKTRLVNNGTEEVGKWTYDFSLHHLPGDQPVPCTITSTVTDPQGHKTETFINIVTGGVNATLLKPELENAQFTLCDPEEDYRLFTDTSPPYLSQRIYKRVVDSNGDESDVLVRSVYKEFEADRGGPTRFAHEIRLKHERMVYNDDSEHQTNTFYSEHDGLGHYRKAVSSSTVPFSGGEKLSYTNYNSSHTHPDQGVATGVDLPANNELWLLNTYGYSLQSQGGSQSLQQFCFDINRGHLIGQRVIKDTSTDLEVGPGDVLYTMDVNDKGFPDKISVFGGDQTNVPVGDLCSTALSADNQVRLEYQHGVISQSHYVDCDGTDLLRTNFNSIDLSGLLISTLDTSDVSTIFKYDLEGRLVCTQMAGSASVWNTYFFPNDGVGMAKTETFTCPTSYGNCSDMCPTSQALTYSSNHYDALGRSVLEKKKVPTTAGIELVETASTYDQMDRLVRAGVWVTSGSSQLPSNPNSLPQSSDTPHTWFKDFDRFGRAQSVVQPDGSVTNTNYTGETLVESSVLIGSPAVLSTKRQIKDGFGRLIQVEEQSGAGGAMVKTTYDYDHADRLTGVCVADQNDNPANCPTTAQNRIFNYDGRGLLVNYTHPEIGIAGNGRIAYSYNALGHPVEMITADPLFDQQLIYDKAGRPTQVRDGNGLLLKELYYSYQNSDDNQNRSNGKLVASKRHNYVLLGGDEVQDLVVTERFAYQHSGGKVSDYSIQASHGVGFDYSILAYDDLGNPTQVRYPQCNNPSCDIEPGRVLNTEYQQGLPTKVPNYANVIQYHRNGGLAKLIHANGVSDERYMDANHWRLGGVEVKAGNISIWSTGDVGYDAAGNIIAIGERERFNYDQVGRLVSSQVLLPNRTVTKNQNLEYDLFGNIRSIHTSDSGTYQINVDTATNRLSNPVIYDVMGNVTEIEIAGTVHKLDIDSSHMIRQLSTGDELSKVVYLYSASNERFASLNQTTGEESYTIRSAGNQVLTRAKKFSDGPMFRDKDYIYGGSQVIATQSNTGIQHLHVDHLGSTRRITDQSSPPQVLQATTLYPFGGNTEEPDPDDEELLFTGHERDSVVNNFNADLDYMHARYYSSYLGRFLSMDPVLGNSQAPQSWNRYGYVQNNPIGNTDPTGEFIFRAIRQFASNPAVKPILKNKINEKIKDPTARAVTGYLLGIRSTTSNAIGLGVEVGTDVTESHVVNEMGLGDNVILNDALDALDVIDGVGTLTATAVAQTSLVAAESSGIIAAGATTATLSAGTVVLAGSVGYASYSATSGAMSILERHGINTPASASARGSFSGRLMSATFVPLFSTAMELANPTRANPSPGVKLHTPGLCLPDSGNPFCGQSVSVPGSGESAGNGN